MRRRARVPERSIRPAPGVACAILACSAALATAARAQSPPATDTSNAGTQGSGQPVRLVRHFDFDERKLGNFEAEPMHWRRHTGAGLPAFGRGQFDDALGLPAPSFRVDMRGGNVGYAYDANDVRVEPRADYLVVGQIRTEGLSHARAFIAAAYCDEDGEALPGTAAVSPLLGSGECASWQRVEVDLGRAPDAARRIRLELWAAQSQQWTLTGRSDSDAIPRQDVRGTVWFDEITVYKLPRVRLSFSHPGGIAPVGADCALLIDVSGHGAEALRAELTVFEPDGAPIAQRTIETSAANERVALPPLEPGNYWARLLVRIGSDSLIDRRVMFAILPELWGAPSASAQFGVDVQPWSGEDIAGLSELIASLECGAVKVPIPTVGPLARSVEVEYLLGVSALLRELSGRRIDTTGVILTEEAFSTPRGGQSTRQAVTTDPEWKTRMGSVLANLGGLLNSWQLGDERGELAEGDAWEELSIAAARNGLRQFLTSPQVVVPRTLLAPASAGREISSVLVPPEIAPRAMVGQLEFLTLGGEGRTWLRFGTESSAEIPASQRVADLARRVVLAKAIEPHRLYFDAPFRESRDGGLCQWQPTEWFVALRTLFRWLADRHAAGVLPVGPDSVGIVFDRPGSSCLIAWTWATEPQPCAIDLFVEDHVRAQDLWGRSVPLDARKGRVRPIIPPTPILVDGVRGPLTLLHATLRIEPTEIEARASRSTVELAFTNCHDSRISGTVEIAAPRDWSVEPASVPFSVEPGQEFRQALSLTLPRRAVATTRNLSAVVHLRSPESADLALDVPIMVGLRELRSRVTASWEGDRLVVEQSLHNLSNHEVNFTAFCQAPGRRRNERTFLRLAPNAAARHRYVFPAARDLAGARLCAGVREIGGERALDHVVDVPQP